MNENEEVKLEEVAETAPETVEGSDAAPEQVVEEDVLDNPTDRGAVDVGQTPAEESVVTPE